MSGKTVQVFRWNKETQTGSIIELDEADFVPAKFPSINQSGETYVSPVTGETIRGNRARERDLAKHGCVDVRDVPKQEELSKIREREHNKSWEAHKNELRERIADW